MKRLIIGLIVLVMMLTMLAGCHSGTAVDEDATATTATTATVSKTTVTTKPTVEKAPPFQLVGTWDASFDFAPSLSEMGVEVDEAIVKVKCTFQNDGIFQFHAENTDFVELVTEHTDAIVRALILMNERSQTVEEYLEQEELTRESFVPVFIEFARLAENVSAVYGTYRFEGDKLIMDDEEALYIYDGNTLTITSMGMTVTFTSHTDLPADTTTVTTTTTTTTATSPTTPIADDALVGTWQGQYVLDMLGFDTQHTLMQTVTYTFCDDGTFTAQAGVPLETINEFLDAVLEEHNKTCEEMFSADRETVIEEVLAVTVGTIGDGLYTINGADVTLATDGFVFIATLHDDALVVDDGGIAYSCYKTEA